MEFPPLPTPCGALFLDFDGTLVDIAETPDGVRVPPTLVETLRELHHFMGGALALVSGRQIDALDRFLAPLILPAAGEHGVQRRNADGELLERHAPDLATVVQAANMLSTHFPGLIVERKAAAVAVHYRLAPQYEEVCRSTMSNAVLDNPSLEVLFGKCVVEVKLAGINKGVAIEEFLQEPPFAGRSPFFLGDDTTDESGFSVVQAARGIAVKVGTGPSGALHRLADSAAVLCWLEAARDAMAAKSLPANSPQGPR